MAAALAMGLAACASRNAQTNAAPPESASESRFGGSFTFDSETQRSVATKSTNFKSGGEFNAGVDAYKIQSFDGGRAYSPDSFSQRTKAYRTSESDQGSESFAGGDARYEGKASGYQSRSSREQAKEFSGVDIPANPYERSSALLGERNYSPAQRAQRKNTPLNIISNSPYGPPEDIIRQEYLSESDVRELLRRD
ncbi:hypothetical protein BH23VER1_BH23VER1_05170 [soil metagenome]